MTRTPLTVHNAEIRTATVEIKTLTLTGKQVTLAVFRQLPRDYRVTSDGLLRGEPWGWVNHCIPDECKHIRHERHCHIVWQQGTALKRCTYSPPDSMESGNVYVAGTRFTSEEWAASPFSQSWQVIRRLPQLFIAV